MRKVTAADLMLPAWPTRKSVDRHNRRQVVDDGRDVSEQQEAIRPTYGMSPNPVLPDNTNPALAGVNVAQQPKSAAEALDGGEASPGVASYDDLIRLMRAQQEHEVLTDRQAKAREMVASLGDLVSALSSMYQTTKGAPVTYTHGQDMNSEVTARNDRERQSRQSRDGRLMENYYRQLQMRRADEQQKQAEKYRERQLANEERRLSTYERNVARMEAKDDLARDAETWKEQYQQGLLDAKAAERRIKEAYNNKIISLRERDLYLKELKLAQDASTTQTISESKDDGFGNVETTNRTVTTVKGGGSSSGSNDSKKDYSNTRALGL